MAEVRGTFTYNDGLRPGRSSDGGMSQLLYDADGGLVAHGSFHPDDEQSAQGGTTTPALGTYGPADVDTDKEVSLAEIVGLSLALAGVIAAPQVTRWWKSTAGPRLKRRWRGLRKAASKAELKRNRGPARSELKALSKDAATQFSMSVDALIEDRGTTMSSAEAARRLAAMLAAAAFVAEELRTLSNVRIEDDPDLAALERAMARLSAPEVTERANRLLESQSASLDDSISVDLMNYFNGGRVVEGTYRPIQQDRIVEMLRVGDDDPGRSAD